MPGKKKKKSIVSTIPQADMLSFTGIMLILLAFFIVLSTMAEEKKTELMKSAQRSFIEQLETYGLSRVLDWRKGVVNLDRFSEENSYPRVMDAEPLDDGALCTMIDKELEIDYRRLGSKVVIPTQVVFEPEVASISKKDEEFLDKLIKLVKNRPCRIIIEGHVDTSFISSKEFPTSWELSASRAAAVAEYIHEKGDISFNRLSVIGYGKFRPLVGSDTPTLRGKNDRVNIIIDNKI